jgi:parallel beta-helix repeat protein
MKIKARITLVFIILILIDQSIILTQGTKIQKDIYTDKNYEEYTENDGIIYIDYKTDFANHSSVREGDGTKNNPYQIKDWRVRQIVISSVSSCFEIKHCKIIGGVDISWALHIKHVASDFKINDCIITEKYGISIEYCKNAEINNCIFETYKGQNAIELFWSSNITINECIIKNYFYGVYLASFSQDNIVEGCIISENVAWGFQLLDSYNNTIRNCEISDFTDWGFRLAGTTPSVNNEIYDCTVKNGEGYGFTLEESDENHIYRCEVTDCDTGIYMHRCYDNIIYHNNICSNTGKNVEVTLIGENQWNKDGEGNFWGKTEYQINGIIDSDGDGIGDKGYYISYDEEDKYPLIKPYGTPFPPVIKGPKKARAGTSYQFTFNSTDHNNDEVTYHIDWGQKKGRIDEFGPCPSNMESMIMHHYGLGEFNIRAKAKDTTGAESDWSKDYTLIMPKNNVFSRFKIFNILSFLFTL